MYTDTHHTKSGDVQYCAHLTEDSSCSIRWISSSGRMLICLILSSRGVSSFVITSVLPLDSSLCFSSFLDMLVACMLFTSFGPCHYISFILYNNPHYERRFYCLKSKFKSNQWYFILVLCPEITASSKYSVQHLEIGQNSQGRTSPSLQNPTASSTSTSIKSSTLPKFLPIS